MALDRDTLAATIVGTGGAWLLGSALFQPRSGRWNGAQRRGLVYAGIGFLCSAAAARWLQPYGGRGIAVGLAGTALALRGMYVLVRERAAERAANRAAAAAAPEKPGAPE